MMNETDKKIQALQSDIDTLIREMRDLREENRQIRLSHQIMAQRLADERNEPLIKWT